MHRAPFDSADSHPRCAETAFGPLVAPAAELSAEEIARYSRQVIINEWGLVGQRRLKNARVLVVGAGGLGSPALQYLAAAGVGTLGVIDGDVVEESNLHRQVVHGQSDIGRSKINSARASIAEINPQVKVVGYDCWLDHTNAEEIFTDYDLVLDGTDNFATRYLVNDAAALVGIPYVWGSILQFSGQVSVFWAAYGPQYRDLHPEPPPPGTVPSCAEGGVLGVLCATIGSIMVSEAIKLITGIGQPLLGRVLVHDALEMTFSTLVLRPAPGGELITRLQPPRSAHEITVTELAGWLADRERGERQFTVIDVREPAERELNAIEGSVLVPMAMIIDGTELPPGQLVLYCHRGQRSAECVQALREQGRTDVVHVAGGIAAWLSEHNQHPAD